MKIVFVNFGRENLGIEYLSAVLKKYGFETSLANDPGLFTKEDNVFCLPLLEKIFDRRETIIQDIVKAKPKMTAFSVYTSTYGWACDLASELKKRLDIKIVFGGSHPTLLPEEVIKNNFVDFVIVGEGEFPFLELARALSDNSSFENISNLVYKKNNNIFKNKIRAPIENLDDLPLPDKQLFEKHVLIKYDYMILASRGCFFSCSYCGESYLKKLYQNKYLRRRSARAVVEELKIMKERYNFKEVMFFDSILFTDKKWLRELIALYKNDINLPFRCTGHVNFFDYEIGKLMKDSGCYCIDFGVQTFNQEVRRKILNRHEDNLQIKKTLKLCDELKLRYDLDLMFGLPGVVKEDYLSAFDFLKGNKYLNRIKCYNLAYYPGMNILDLAKKNGILDEKDVEKIKNGEINDWFHQDFIKDVKHKKWKNDFQKLYKIYSIIPVFARGWVTKYKLYRLVAFIPGFLVIFVQWINAVMKRDYRFKIYINNYIYQFKRRFLR